MITNGRIAVAHLREGGKNATFIDFDRLGAIHFHTFAHAGIVAIYGDNELRIVKSRYTRKMNELPFDDMMRVNQLIRLNDQALTLG